MKKIGFVFTYKSGATLNRILSMCNVLSDHEIHLVGPLKSLQAYEGYFKKSKIFFHELPLSKNKYSNFLLRYLSEFKYSFKCSRKLNSLNCDVEIISVPYISLILSSKLFQNRSMKILDVRDLVWEYYERDKFFQKIIFYFLKKIHLFFLKKYKLITLTNEFEFNKINKHLTNSKIIQISNGISKSKFIEIQSKLNERINTHNHKRIIITYIGNVGLAQNLITFINVIKEYKEFEFRIVGDGNDYDNVSNFITTNKIDNVNLTGRVKENEVVKYYVSTDILYAKLEPKYYTAIPSKLYEYLSTGKPIIYSGNGAAVEFLKKFENIFIIDDNKKKISNFLNSGFQLNISKKNNRNINIIKENFIRENINLNLIKIIN